MIYDYNSIIKEMKSFETVEEKKEFLDKIIADINTSESTDYTDIPSDRFEHLTKRINYLENMFILRNLVIEAQFDDKS